jgi:hypothetical protein
MGIEDWKEFKGGVNKGNSYFQYKGCIIKYIFFKIKSFNPHYEEGRLNIYIVKLEIKNFF